MRRLRELWLKLLQYKNRLATILSAFFADGRLQIGKEVRFHALARVDGRGVVLIRYTSVLSYKMVPGYCNGEILFQAGIVTSVVSRTSGIPAYFLWAS